jgi:hypothetical protein
MKLACFASLVIACGGGGNNAPDATTCADAGPACGSACPATFTGNLDASSTTPANCAQLGAGSGSASADTVLAFALASPMLDAPLEISVDLGASPSAGTYSSETSTSWSALGSRSAPASGSNAAGECVYSAGAEGVPTGSFAMTLTAIDAASAHGELRVVQYLQAQAGVDCGSGDVETVDVRF